MTTKLDSPLKREVLIDGLAYTITIDARGVKLVPKGKRKGYDLEWQALVSGDAALATALNASLANAPAPPGKPPRPQVKKTSKPR